MKQTMSQREKQILIQWASWLFPLLILFISYTYLAYELNTPFLFFTQVHENGKYTLLETMFYFDHFIRELPVSALTACIVAISFYLFSPVQQRESFRALSILKIIIPFLLVFLILVIAGALLKNGFHSLLLDLLQFRTRDDLISYGSHWDSHLLHIEFIFFISLAMSFIYRGITHKWSASINKRGIAFLITWQAVIVLVTIAFIPDTKSFIDTRYLAHQFREIITHISISIPFAFALLIGIENKLCPGPHTSAHASSFKNIGLFSLIGSLTIPLYILVQLSGRNIMAEAQKQSNYFNLLASHYFEHTLDYIFIPPLAVTIFIILVNTSKRKDDQVPK